MSGPTMPSGRTSARPDEHTGSTTGGRTGGRTGWRTAGTTRRVPTGARRWLPTPHAWGDHLVLLVLCALALASLTTTFTGLGPWVVGVLGVAVGVLIGHLTRAARWPAVAGVLIGVLAFLLLGGPLCLAAEGQGAPTPSTFAALGDQVVGGWKDLLTTLPPVDGDGPARVLPWALGLAAGLLGTLTRDLVRGPLLVRAALPLLAPVLLLGTVILIGVGRPQSLLLQGVVFTAVALGWLAWRTRRAAGPLRGQRAGGARRLSQPLAAALMLAVAAGVALPVADLVADDDQRVVLRSYVEPPFDIGQYPSPLASFRRYVELPERRTDPANLYDVELASITGVPAGTRMRIATLDAYDGTVWGAADSSGSASAQDGFQRVSSVIDNPVEGRRVEGRITLGEGYSGVWLPSVGALTSLEIEGDDARHEAQRESFRYNLATSTGVVPAGLGEGDSVEFSAVLPPEEVDEDDASSGEVTDAAFAAAFLNNQATTWSAGAGEPMARVFAIAEHLKTEGRYSDGVAAAERIYHPGHGVKRLGDEFANAPIMVGNDEQYAAIMALLANNVGVPARVVLGAVVPEGGVVHGRDVQAWVELQVADGSWRTLPTEEFMSTVRPAEQPPLAEQPMSGTVVPPPAPIPPPSTLAEQNDAELEARKVNREGEDGPLSLPAWLRALLLYVGVPLLLALLVVGAIVGAKAWRRRRRRTAARTSARIVGGWRELVDHARDLGQPVPVGAGSTRREQSFRVASAQAPTLARRADGHVFGPRVPDDATAEAFWEAVEAERRSMSRAVGRRRRLRAALSLTTFRRRR
ncbi:transglutaminase-like domain-containing protein [Nocardioides nanhaiensis]|uniref:Transglutaminase-like domain-containing protein n=1 Tax=Nocardioides nanhaiensis TaxID=1476871 RepID=A0ABP8VYY2_9ACTN